MATSNGSGNSKVLAEADTHGNAVVHASAKSGTITAPRNPGLAMSFKTVCPSCDSELTVPDAMLGKRWKCKKCGDPFTVRRSARPDDDDDAPPRKPNKTRPEYDEDDEPRSKGRNRK